jgi:heat-inducible transcriptional repressor
VREKLLREMQEVRDSMNAMMQAAIEMADQMFEENKDDEGDYVLAGQTNLMGFEELSDVEKLRKLFETFNKKRDFLHLLDHSLNAQGVQIFIGHESGCMAFDGCSLITSTYEMDGKAAGVLGVIGPTRMAYDRVVPVVDITAKLLSAALNQRN